MGNKQINEVFDVSTKNYDPFSSDHANSGLANLATGKIAHKDTDNYLKTCIDEGRKARIAFQAGCVEYSANFLKTLKRRLVNYFPVTIILVNLMQPVFDVMVTMT